jgi:electron transfer flavoprotein alpha subunit
MTEYWAILERNAAGLHEQSGELISELLEVARRKAESVTVCAVLLTDQQTELPDLKLLPQMGIQRLYLLLHPRLADYATDDYVAALAWLVQQHTPALMVAHATPNGRDWTPRLAAQLCLPFAPNCLGFDLHDNVLLALRSIYEGRAYAQTSTSCHVRPALATLLPGIRGVVVGQRSSSTPSTSFETMVLYPELPARAERIRRIAIQAPSPEEVALDVAERIVAGGRGVGQEGFSAITQFAHRLGAAVGATRVATDLGWVEHSRQIGSTGKTVRPKLYIACGISGAVQHTSGMSESQTIIAINPDRSAPIFALADLGLLGDANQILPLAVQLLQSEQHGRKTNPFI